MIGGMGNDTYHVDDNTGSLVVAGFGISIGDIIYRFGDRVIENANEGTDTVVTTVDYTLASNVENLELAAGAGHINGYGNSLANYGRLHAAESRGASHACGRRWQYQRFWQ